MPTVMLFSDQPVLARGVKETLAGEKTLKFFSHNATVEELYKAIHVRPPDLLLLDLTRDFTLDFLTSVHLSVPASKIVLWAHFISTEMALQAMNLGVKGILAKTIHPELLISTLKRIGKGELSFDEALTDSIRTVRRYQLTKREGRIVSLVSQGLKNKNIGLTLNISDRTVKVHMTRLLKKLELKDHLELALFGLKNLTAGYSSQKAASVALATPTVSPILFRQGWFSILPAGQGGGYQHAVPSIRSSLD